jgi:hypothetical protein
MFTLLEAFSDGMGTWKYLPGNGSLLDQPEAMMDDLLQWKYLANILHKQEEKRKERNSHAPTRY